MLIFQESGRLGNQIFQYAALRSLCKENETLLLLGFSELQSVFDGIEAKIINQKTRRIVRGIYYRIYRRGYDLTKLKITSKLYESVSSKHREINYKYGLISNFIIVENSYFQGENFFKSEYIKSLSIKPELVADAQQKIDALTQGKIPIFVHVRRGDYVSWPNQGFPAILSSSYYYRSIEIIKKNIANPMFIFISDDLFYVRDIFGNLPNSYISNGSMSEDFVLMTQCKGGILSASSFSWWGAYLAKQQYSDTFFLAPKYWAGHRQKEWFPESIESSFLSYVDI